jgi:hypothetical protein
MPVESVVEPPVATRPQLLPLAKLSWTAFERLCVRLAKREADIQYCYQYGVPGQEQEGIDLYGRTASQRFTTWQCKRYRSFSASKLRAAADKFLEAAWAERTERFHVCVTVALEQRPLIDEVQKQIERFRERDIAFEPLGVVELSERLKVHPDLVDDFFGRPWALAFCGDEVVQGLRGRRLGTGEVLRLRRTLRQYYVSHFEALDPGLPVAAGQMDGVPLSIDKRYVFPDVLEERRLDVGSWSAPPEGDRGRATSADQRQDRRPDKRAGELAVRDVATTQVRVPIATWLQRGDRFVVLGDAGVGKSTFLRLLALDLLSDNPIHESWARAWGHRLPVWVPFPMWTRMVADSERDCSLREAIRTWLTKIDAPGDLQQLVDDALEDDRLLLLIDGLDEWSNEAAAGTALTLLKTFVGARPIATVATGRPVAYERLGSLGHGWRAAALAPFTSRQQRVLAERWFRHQEIQRAESPTEEIVNRRAGIRATDFMTSIQREPAIAELASVPLLLSALIALSIHRVELPSNRFRAYEQMTELLLRDQPRRRAKAAMARQRVASLSDESRERALSDLAYRMATSPSAYVCDKEQATRLLMQHFERFLGTTGAEAHKHAEQLLEEAQISHGMLAEKSPRDIGFIHRVFQDFLAAQFLSRQPFDDQRKFITSYYSASHSHDIILALLHLNTREAEVDGLIAELQALATVAPDDYRIPALLGETAFANVNCSARVAQLLADSAVARAESGDWTPIRRRLVETAAGGLNSDVLGPRILQVLRSWFPRSTTWKNGIYRGSLRWKDQASAVEILLRGLCDEESRDRHAAAEVLAERAAGDANVQARLEGMLEICDTGPAAAVLNALARGWGGASVVEALLNSARESRDDEIKMIAACRRVDLGQHTINDRDMLLELARDHSSFKITYDHGRDITGALVKGWPGDDYIRSRCIESLSLPRWQQRDGLEPGIAGSILASQVPHEQSARLFAEIFRSEQYPDHRFGEILDLLVENYAGEQVVAAAIDDWLAAYGTTSSFHTERIAAIARTESAKNVLLDPERTPAAYPYWTLWALLKGWGPTDPDTIAFAKQWSDTSVRAQHIASLLPEAGLDRDRCSSILRQALADPAVNRLDFVIDGLYQLQINDQNAADAFFDRILDPESFGFDGAVSAAIRAFSFDPRARHLALRELDRDGGSVAAVAETFGDDDEIRGRLITMSTALDANLRGVLVNRLSEQAVNDEEALSLLAAYDRETDATVRTAASIGYWRARQAHGDVSEADLDGLMTNLRVGGMYTARRQAAFAGLVVLGRLHEAVNATYAHMPQHRIMKVDFFHGPNMPLVRLLTEDWRTTTSFLGNIAWQTVEYSTTSTIDALVVYADEREGLREALLDAISSTPARNLGPNALRFWGDHAVSSPETLRQRFLDAIAATGHSLPERLRRSATAQAISDRFAGDAETYARLIALAAGGNDAAAEAVCNGWPDSRFAANVSLDWEKVNPSRDCGIVIAVTVNQKSAEDLVGFLADLITKLPGDGWELLPQSFNPVVRRLSRDSAFRDAALRLLITRPSDDDAASWPGLLRRAGFFTPELRSWCEQQLIRRAPETFTRTGLDVNYGRIRSVRHALLDALSPLKT